MGAGLTFLSLLALLYFPRTTAAIGLLLVAVKALTSS